MSASSLLRAQIEAALSARIPSALTPVQRVTQQVTATGIRNVDELLQGGLPNGALTEMVGPESSGRTSLALSFIAGMTQAGRVCAWIDVSDTLHPESAAGAGVDLRRLLWVRCGVPLPTSSQHFSSDSFCLPKQCLIPPPIKRGLYGGGVGSHPRGEVKGLSGAIPGLFRSEANSFLCAGPPRQPKSGSAVAEPRYAQEHPGTRKACLPDKPWARLDQALRVTDLLLQNGGFGAIVLDMGSLSPDHALRVPLATWFRFRAAAEQKQTNILLLMQHPCAKSSAGLTLRLQSGGALHKDATVFTGIEYCAEIVRERFTSQPTNVQASRKPPQNHNQAFWQSRTAWTIR